MGSQPPGENDALLAEVADIAIGTRIAGYRLEEQIGQGGMAVVFRARDERLDRPVALKILAPALATDEGFRRRFSRESRAATAADDPHIIPVFEAGEANGVLFIAMRYVGGGDVGTLVRRHGPLPAARAAAIVSPVAAALDAAHGVGLVHRDVKPTNMLLDVRLGRPDHVYLSDFGLSKSSLSSVMLTGTGRILGTPDYAAPEQLMGEPVDGRADQYSLACAAFEMLGGVPPFVRELPVAVIYAHTSEPPPRLTSLRPDLPPAVDQVLARALAKTPGERYPTCQDFAESLRAALGLQPYDAESARHERPATVVAGLPPVAAMTTSAGAVRTLGGSPASDVDTGRGSADVTVEHTYPDQLQSAAGPSAAGPRPKRRRAALAAGALVLIGGGAGLATQLSHGPGPATSLTPVPGLLTGVATGSAASIWSVGFSCLSSCLSASERDRTVIVRWNGSGWSRVSSPSPGLRASLNAVSAGSAGSAWAVGEFCVSGCGTGAEADQTLILRWNGAAWSQVTSPSPGQIAFLGSVSASPTGSAWAVGRSCVSGCATAIATGRTLILRWNGAAWSEVASPSPGVGAGLDAVTAGPGGTWAAGSFCLSGCGTDRVIARTLILRWNGAAWSKVASPSPGQRAYLNSLTSGPAGTWAAGWYCRSGCSTGAEIDRALLLRWDGAAWSTVTSPSPGMRATLNSVATGAGGTWAAGWYCVSACGTGAQIDRTLLLRWDGVAWSTVTSPSPGPRAYLNSVTSGPAGTWAVGKSCVANCRAGAGSSDQTLVLRRNALSWAAG